MNKIFNRHSKKFTLIELMVVVVVIAILASLLMPALAKAKFRARLATCQSSLRQIGLGIMSYTGDYEGWYPTDGFARAWPYQNERSKTLQPDYFGFDYTQWSVDQPPFQCAQGLAEVPWKPGSSKNTHSGGRASYYYYFDLMLCMSASTSPTAPDGIGHTPATPQYLMRRAGYPFTVRNGTGRTAFGDIPMEFNILASDVTLRTILKDLGYALSTNHIWGGENLREQVHFSGKPLYFGTLTGMGYSNYLFDDGSVQMKNITFSMFGGATEPMVYTGQKGYALPKEFGSKP